MGQDGQSCRAACLFALRCVNDLLGLDAQVSHPQGEHKLLLSVKCSQMPSNARKHTCMLYETATSLSHHLEKSTRGLLVCMCFLLIWLRAYTWAYMRPVHKQNDAVKISHDISIFIKIKDVYIIMGNTERHLQLGNHQKDSLNKVELEKVAKNKQLVLK